MDADGSNRRILTETFDRSPRGILWAPDESGIYLNVESDGWRNLYFRSEERRVGKECRSRWSPYH